jgi:methylated-DNA-[protein]-cysteine S-methyltransferase
MRRKSPRAPSAVPHAARVVFKTPWGWMGLAGSDQGLCAVVLPKSQAARVTAALSMLLCGVPSKGGIHNGRQNAQIVVNQAQRQLMEYVAGQRRSLDLPIDLRCGSPFQRRVWRAIRGIPYGRVRSYKWVAMRVGGARYARAVGNALGANPLPIVVPCHRVVAHDASLGGFTGGLQTKRRLLGLEGILPLLRGSHA